MRVRELVLVRVKGSETIKQSGPMSVHDAGSLHTSRVRVRVKVRVRVRVRVRV